MGQESSSRLWEITNHGENSTPRDQSRVTCKFPAGPELVVWDHRRKNKDNVMVLKFNYVEFAQGKVRIARDTTVNDYLCCNGGKCLGPSFTHSSLPNGVLSCSIGDAVGINRHLKEKNTDSHFSIYLGGTRSAQAQQIPVSTYVAETVQHSDSSQVNGL